MGRSLPVIGDNAVDGGYVVNPSAYRNNTFDMVDSYVTFHGLNAGTRLRHFDDFDDLPLDDFVDLDERKADDFYVDWWNSVQQSPGQVLAHERPHTVAVQVRGVVLVALPEVLTVPPLVDHR